MNNNTKISLTKKDLIDKILDNDKDLEKCNISEDLLHQLISGKISKNIYDNNDKNLTLGQKTADKLAAFGGSWTFIISFSILLLTWIVINTIILVNKPFDPYPFVFLNLMLSCLAALQAPIIMMSQNRQSEKDRLTASNDYLVNLKSEIIIEDLHYKLDLLMEQHEESKKTQEILLKAIEELKKSKN